MVKIIKQGVYFAEGRIQTEAHAFMTSDKKARAIKNTISYSVLKSHGASPDAFQLKIDRMVAEGANAVELACSLEAAGVKTFFAPFAFVAGNADAKLQRDLYAAAAKFGGIYVPANLADASMYLNECAASCGETVLSPLPFAVGAVGAMGITAGPFKMLKRLCGIVDADDAPQIIAVYLKGKLRRGVGPTDVSLALQKALKTNFLEGKILEFFGPALSNLSLDARIAIDEAILKTGRLASVWETDRATEAYYSEHGKKGFKTLSPVQPAFYDGAVVIDLTRIEPMISINGTITSLKEACGEERKICACSVGGNESGTFENLAEVSEILRGRTLAEGLYTASPATQECYTALAEAGYLKTLAEAGVVVAAPLSAKGTVCMLSSGENAVLDVRSLAASLVRGKLTSALDIEYVRRLKKFTCTGALRRAVMFEANPEAELPCEKTEILPLAEHLLLETVSGSEKYRAEEKEFKFERKEGTARASVVCVPANLPRDTERMKELRKNGCAAVLSSSFLPETEYDLVMLGMVPLRADKSDLKIGEFLYLEGVAEYLGRGEERIVAKRVSRGKTKDVVLQLPKLSDEGRKILLYGGILGYCKQRG